MIMKIIRARGKPEHRQKQATNPPGAPASKLASALGHTLKDIYLAIRKKGKTEIRNENYK
jgi:hypothetical protein